MLHHIILTIFALNFGAINCLRCYQGQTKMGGGPLTSSSIQCPMQAYSCILSIDHSQGIATRACQSTNCTTPGTYQITSTPVCQNTTGYPPQTFCCCYGDACNAYENMTAQMPANVTAPALSIAVVCSPNGIWGNWSEWTRCPSDADGIFRSLGNINQQMRFRQCLPQPSGCMRREPFMCDGQHMEQRQCGGEMAGNANNTTNGTVTG